MLMEDSGIKLFKVDNIILIKKVKQMLGNLRSKRISIE